MACGEPLAASQHRSHSMQCLSKTSCVIFARPHTTHQTRCNSEFPLNQHYRFLMLSVNTPPFVMGWRNILHIRGREKCHETSDWEDCDYEQQPQRAGIQETSQASGTISIPNHWLPGDPPKPPSAFHFQIVWRPKSACGPEANNKDTIQYGADYANKPDQPLNANTGQNTLANNDRLPQWQKGYPHIHTLRSTLIYSANRDPDVDVDGPIHG